MAMDEMKYYGIGMVRTGTSSLCKAFQQMGFKSNHYIGTCDLEIIGEYDFVDDAPIPFMFKIIDAYFPHSKFIYTIRDMESWLVSIEKHFGSKGNKCVRRSVKDRRKEIYGAYKFDRDIFIDAYKKHDKNVKEYFKNRQNDLLTVDICNGEGWDKLISFIGEENIKNNNFNINKFPYLNKRS